MKRALVISMLALTFASFAATQTRVDRVINGQWKFARENAAQAASATFDDRGWETVNLPHTWNARDGQDGGNDYYRGTGWYRKQLSLDPAWRGRSIFLRFDGAATIAQVFVNGVEVGVHKGNFGAFCFEVTKHLRFDGGNVIAAKVNNARDTTVAPLRGDFTIFGGIYRDVHILVMNPVSISPLDFGSSGVYVHQAQVSSDLAKILVETHLRNAGDEKAALSVRCSVLDAQGRIVAKASGDNILAGHAEVSLTLPLEIPRPHLWHGKQDPYLYTVNVVVREGKRVLDQVTETTGIRSFLIDDEQGFILNGKPYRLCGVNRHQDRENVGWAIGPKEHKEDFALIQEIGATAVRLAHYQHAKEFYALCDRGGMVVWAELALVDEILPNEQFRDNLRHQLTELIKQNYNHPAICFWSLQNELVPDNDRTLYGNIVEELHLLARALDSTRPTTVASRSKYDPDEKMNSVSDLLAYNVYRGWYEGKPEGFAAFADRLHAKYPQRKMAISEYGAGAGIHQHEWPVKKPAPRGAWHPEEWQSVVHEITWKAIEERTYLWGSFLWNMFDFGSDGRSEGEQTGQNDKGLVSYDRKIKKDAFFFYKAHWNPEPMVYITSRRYNPRPEGITTVKAYANCEAVELFVNGKSFGKKTGSDHIYVWDNVALSEGTARVSVVGTVGTRRLKDSCEWVVVSAGR